MCQCMIRSRGLSCRHRCCEQVAPGGRADIPWFTFRRFLVGLVLAVLVVVPDREVDVG